MFGWDNNDQQTVVNALASALRRDISFGVLAPDQKLKIEDLRARYGGSKHSLRETLRLLSAEGLVEAVAQRGFRVTSATPDDLSDIALIRTEVEKLALARAMEFGDVQWEGRVIASHHALQKIESQIDRQVNDLTALEWDEAYRTFSASMFDACQSPRLIDLQRKYFDQSRRFRLALLREGRLDFTARRLRHQALVDAVTARDTVAATELLQQDINAELQIS
jgi:DNA-binding GntR family transcriptional regulator